MKQKLLIAAFLMNGALLACKTGNTPADNATPAITDTSVVAANSSPKDSFDITAIPVSHAVLDSFPFWPLPNGMQSQNKPEQRDYEQLYFPYHGNMMPLKGRIFRTAVVGKTENTWSQAGFLEYYEKALANAGGVRISNTKVPTAVMDSLGKQGVNFGGEGIMDYWNEPVESYVVRNDSAGNVFVQFYANSAAGAIQILQQKKQ